jgi:hypothetical protein
VADPGYDFFATAAPAGSAELTTESAPVPAVSRFGTPLPQEQAAPAAPAYAAPAPPAAAVPAPVPGYHPGAVNQFGTPTDLPAVPTGPYAAPGLGAAPIEAPGLVSTWSGPAVPEAAAQPVAVAAPVAPPAPAAAPVAPLPPAEPVAATPVAVSRFGSPIPPDVLVEDPTYAALAFGTPVAGTPGYAPPGAGHRTAAPMSDAKPSAVTTAGIIGIVEGGLLILLGLLGLMGYLALKSQLDALAASPELAGSGLSVSSLTNLVLVGVLIALLIGAGYVVAGIATLRGARWGAWALLVVSAINVLYGLYELVSGDAGFGTLLSIGVSGAVVVLLCLGDSMRWLRRA